jgi:CRP/FNR family transcriptional regulator, dissimilatory nitrate respiration regulator
MNMLLADLRRAAIANQLRRAHLFAGCPSSTLESIAAQTTAVTLAPGQCLFRENTPANAFFVVQQGAVKLYRVTALGREQIIHIFRPFESFAEETLVSDSCYTASACATEPSQVLAMSKTGFVGLLRSYPELALRLLNALGRQFDLLVGRIDDLRLKGVQTRVSNWLLQHCPDPDSAEPQTIRLSETKRLLAAELGTCSETFSRTLARMRAAQLVSVKGKTVTVLCPFRLAQSARGGSGATPFPASHCRPAKGWNIRDAVPTTT